MSRSVRKPALRAVLLLALFGAVAWGDASGNALPGGEPDRVEEAETQRMFQQTVALGIPEAALAAALADSRAAGFTPVDIRRVLSLMAKAKLAGLPHDDLLNKLREGLAKGVPPEGIERALESKAQALRRAKTLVDTLVTEGRTAPDYGLAVKIVADALDAGSSGSEVLRAVREGRPPAQGLPDVRSVFRDLPARPQ